MAGPGSANPWPRPLPEGSSTNSANLRLGDAARTPLSSGMAQRSQQPGQSTKQRRRGRSLPARARQARPYLARLSPALFVVALGLALAALYQAKQTVTSHRETTERLIRDYGAFAAWSFRQHAAERL